LAGTPRSVSITFAASSLLARKSTKAAASTGCLERDETDQNIDGL
jgi:hypothetical protein